MKKICGLSILVLALTLCLSAVLVVAEEETKVEAYTLSMLTEKIDELGKKEVVISGTIIGICKSGCKMWIAEGEYKKGDPYALVRAKDDAFKFDKQATGKKVILHGYAVAKYMDYCAETGEEQEGVMDKCETPVETSKEAAEQAKTEQAKVEKGSQEKTATTKRELKDVTFFATKVEYL